MNSTIPLVLASTSPYRRALLGQLGLAFDIVKPAINEARREGESPRHLVERLAIEKARAGAEQAPGSLVIGSDQVAVHGDTVVGKPHDHEDAIKQLLSASATTVTLLTGVALVNARTGVTQSDVEPFYVTFRPLDLATIEAYLYNAKPYDCCGSLRVEGPGIALLEKLSGDDPNALIGLPLIRLARMLEGEGVKLF